MAITGKPVLIDRMNPELGARIVELIIDDNERAQKRKAERKARRAAKKRDERDARPGDGKS